MAESEPTTQEKPKAPIQSKHSGMQLAGLFLWRFGVFLAGATAIYNSVELVMRFVDFPLQIEIGVGLIIGGGIVVLVSFVMERVVDMRAEGDLSQP